MIPLWIAIVAYFVGHLLGIISTMSSNRISDEICDAMRKLKNESDKGKG